MKTYIKLIAIMIMVFSCGEDTKNKTVSETDATIKINEEAIIKDNSSTDNSSDDLEKALGGLNGLLNAETNNQDNQNTTTGALQELLKMGESDASEANTNSSLGNLFSSSAILDMLEKSGVSRESLEKLINNPDSLKILAQKAIQEREAEQGKKQSFFNKSISKEQLETKQTKTGVSLEEAILLVQAESGPEATMAKLKTIDSLAGTNIMEQLDLKEAGSVMRDVEHKNNRATPEERKILTDLRNRSGQLHSEREATELLQHIEETEKAIASGKIKASKKYTEAIAYRKKSAKIYHKNIVAKSKVAKAKFKKLNPDLFYGDNVGLSYVGHRKTTVYLPLGPLSFADEVVSVNHPQLLTQEVNNVLGEPDVIETFDDATGYYSLGLGGSLTIRFTNNALVDVNGPDLYLFEIGQIEPTDLEISKDGKFWINIGKIDGGVAEVDISAFVKPNELFYYVRFKDLKSKSAEAGADVDAIAAIGSALRLNLDSQVLFDSGKSTLKPAGINALKALVNSITVLKKGKIIVEGHTDDVGSDATNNALSLARAKSVSKALRKLIPSTQFKWQEKGYGKRKPLVENNSDKNRSKNRRVEILVVPN